MRETAYGLQCLDYWLHSPSGLPLSPPPDIIVFNFGMHDYQPSGSGVPGQSGNSSVYPGQLAALTTHLLAYAAANPPAKVVFALTTPYLCDATVDAAINGTLNAAARTIMARWGVPVLDNYGAIRAHCGGTPPTSGCNAEPSWGTDWCVWYRRAGRAAPARGRRLRA